MLAALPEPGAPQPDSDLPLDFHTTGLSPLLFAVVCTFCPPRSGRRASWSRASVCTWGTSTARRRRQGPTTAQPSTWGDRECCRERGRDQARTWEKTGGSVLAAWRQCPSSIIVIAADMRILCSQAIVGSGECSSFCTVLLLLLRHSSCYQAAVLPCVTQPCSLSDYHCRLPCLPLAALHA